jgi:hypothetical protein
MTAEHIERPSLLDGHADAITWVEQQKVAHEGNPVFGNLVSAVIWTDGPSKNDELVVPVDPAVLVDRINTDGLPLYREHDPGFPVGRVLAAKRFTSTADAQFVAAVFGLYSEEKRISFGALGVDSNSAARLPESLPPLADRNWIQFDTDSREVDATWIESVVRDAPLPVKRRESAHYAAVSLHELILIGLPYVVLVWNPFVKSFATEAGKDAYAGVHRWLQSVWDKLASRRNPVVRIAAHQGNCLVSFIFRGKDVNTNYAAHEALSIAAAQAAQLVTHMEKRGVAPRSLVYEFESGSHKWFPSYAELHDGRLVSDRKILIAIEQLPSYVSLGITRGDD